MTSVRSMTSTVEWFGVYFLNGCVPMSKRKYKLTADRSCNIIPLAALVQEYALSQARIPLDVLQFLEHLKSALNLKSASIAQALR